jgi:spermidine synthase
MAPSTDSDPSSLSSPPLVITRGDLRTLEFVAGEVQSEMRLSRPSALVLAYSRAMMCFALFVPRPRHILMVGLGGGSLAKFCYRHFPHARITVLELRADVIALRAQFCVPPDDERFTVLHADASLWLTQTPDSVDVLLVDGFDAAGLPQALGSSRFYADCRRALRHGGVLAANIFSYDPLYPAMLGRLRLVFGGQVCWLDKVAGNNRILFAVKAPLDMAATTPARRTRALFVQQLMSRRRWLGLGFLNRLLVRALVAYLARPRVKRGVDPG